LAILSHHSVNENGDENGERLNAFTRNPFSSPFSLTDLLQKSYQLIFARHPGWAAYL
jgi:hypothetical protein